MLITISIMFGITVAILFMDIRFRVRNHEENMSWYLRYFAEICNLSAKIVSFFSTEYFLILSFYSFLGYGGSDFIEQQKESRITIVLSSIGIGFLTGLLFHWLITLICLVFSGIPILYTTLTNLLFSNFLLWIFFGFFIFTVATSQKSKNPDK